MSVVNGIDTFVGDTVRALCAHGGVGIELVRKLIPHLGIELTAATVRCPLSELVGVKRGLTNPYKREGSDAVWHYPGGPLESMLAQKGDGKLFSSEIMDDVFGVPAIRKGQRGAWLADILKGLDPVPDIKCEYAAYAHVLTQLACAGDSSPDDVVETLTRGNNAVDDMQQFIREFMTQSYECQRAECAQDNAVGNPSEACIASDREDFESACALLSCTDAFLEVRRTMGSWVQRMRDKGVRRRGRKATLMDSTQLGSALQFATSQGLVYMRLEVPSAIRRRKRSYVDMLLTAEGVDRIIYSLRAYSQAYIHLVTLGMEYTQATHGDLIATRSKCRRLLKLGLDMMAESPAHRKQYIPAVLHKMFGVYVAALGGRNNSEQAEAVVQEAKESCTEEEWEYFGEFKRLLFSLPAEVAQDFGRQVKLFCSNDVDLPCVMAKRQQSWLEQNSHSHVNGVELTERELNDCWLELDRALTKVVSRGLAHVPLSKAAVALAPDDEKGEVGMVGAGRMRRDNPEVQHYLNCGRWRRSATLADMDDLDMDGAAVYEVRQRTDLGALRDSAVCENSLNECLQTAQDEKSSFASRAIRLRRNMLTAALIGENSPSREEAIRSLGSTGQVHRVGPKMEPQKVGESVRLFYVTNAEGRAAKSEMEENTHNCVRSAYGYTVGEDPAKLMNRMADSTCKSPPEGMERVHVCKDCSGWSPDMPADTQRRSHAFWDRVHGGRTPYARAHNFNEDSIAVLNKRGYNCCAQMLGSNLEGSDGKEMTVLHLAMIEVALDRFRRAHPRFAGVTVNVFAFIDDVYLELLVPRADYAGALSAFSTILDETYFNYGFRTSPAKCTESSTYAQFLNEIFFEYRQLGYGLRAFVHVAATPYDDCDHFPGLVSKVASGISGSVKCGMQPGRAIFCLHFLYAMLVKGLYGPLGDLSGGRCGASAALWMSAPKALGGVGAPGPVAATGNLGAPQLFEHSARMFNMLANARTDRDRRRVTAILTTPVSTSEPSRLLSGTPSVRAMKQWRMDETRKEELIREAVLEVCEDKFFSKMLNEDTRDVTRIVGNAVMRPFRPVSTVLVRELAGALDTSVINAFCSKFESSATIGRMVRRDRLRAVRSANSFEARRSCAMFYRRIWSLR